jgi:hypothetical protein
MIALRRVGVPIDGSPVTLRSGESLISTHVYVQAPVYGRVLFTEPNDGVVMDGSGILMMDCVIEGQAV